jgi:hypothetical protein
MSWHLPVLDGLPPTVVREHAVAATEPGVGVP